MIDRANNNLLKTEKIFNKIRNGTKVRNKAIQQIAILKFFLFSI